MALANATAAISRYGEPLKTTDFKFGTFDKVANTFTEDPDSKEAVRAVATFAKSHSNAALSYLFRLIGLTSFDIIVECVWEAYYTGCLNEAMVTVGMEGVSVIAGDIIPGTSNTEWAAVRTAWIPPLNSLLLHSAIGEADLDAAVQSTHPKFLSVYIINGEGSGQRFS